MAQINLITGRKWVWLKWFIGGGEQKTIDLCSELLLNSLESSMHILLTE